MLQQQQPLEPGGSALTVNRPARRSTARLSRYFWLQRVGIPYLFLVPFLILFCLFFILPLGYALGISLFADRLVGGTVFVWLQIFAQAFQHSAFLECARSDFWFGVLSARTLPRLPLSTPRLPVS